MKTIVTALFVCTLCIASGCSKCPSPAPAMTVPSPADRYIGLWVNRKYPNMTVEVKRNGTGFLAKLTTDPGQAPMTFPVTFEPDGSMRAAHGDSFTIDMETGLMLHGVSTLKRVR